jgi:hypothetical protein
MTTKFDFGENKPQMDLFNAVEASSDAPADPKGTTAGEDGAAPIPPLQLIEPKEIRIDRISMALADSYSIEKHYLHRTAKNSKLALGIFARGELHGIMIWGLPVAKIKGQHGDTYTQIELRRMFCDQTLGKNSESRCLAIASRIIKRLLPQTKLLVAYSDLSHGHKGGIYKAAGWIFAGRIAADKDGGWSKHPRHNRVELGDKYKWVKPL